MNVAQNGTTSSFWSLWSFVGVAVCLTIGTLLIARLFSGRPVEVYTLAQSETVIKKRPNLTGSPGLPGPGTYSMYHRLRVMMGSRTRTANFGDMA
jgi:hypothetical protein